MQPLATRARALTAPVVQDPSVSDLSRTTTNPTRNRHAVPPSILAQNREQQGIAERPRAKTCTTESHIWTDPFDASTDESSHCEYGEVTVVTFDRSRRRSTLERLSDSARNTGKNAKRRISKVFSRRRKDSAQEGEEKSRLNKAPRIDLARGSQALEFRTELLGDEESEASPMSSHTSYEDAAGSPASSAVDHSTSRADDPSDEPPRSKKSQLLPALQQGSENARFRATVEFNSRHYALPSPEELPHDSFIERPELWSQSAQRLEMVARYPGLVADRFDQIYKERM